MYLARWSARLRSFELRRGSLRYDRLAEPWLAQPAMAGGARRDRTDDLMLAKHALSQLSYGPVPEDECFKLDETYLVKEEARSIKWWAWEDLNFRPHAYQARALTN
jgi:hypothetical protein